MNFSSDTMDVQVEFINNVASLFHFVTIPCVLTTTNSPTHTVKCVGECVFIFRKHESFFSVTIQTWQGGLDSFIILVASV